MVSTLLLATLLATEPTTDQAKPAKPPKPTPEERLAKLDEARLEMHMGLRGYGRWLGADPAYGGSVQLGAGVRLVRGLYLVGELGAGTHAMPFGAQAQLSIGLQHELRLSKWVRPSFSLGYSHLVDFGFDAGLDTKLDGECGCADDHDGAHDYGVSGHTEVDIIQRSGLQGGFGLRFPMRWAPRLSVYVRGDAAYYFDRAPGRLQGGFGGGLQVVF